MSFFTPYNGVLQFDELEVECDQCGHLEKIPRPGKDASFRLLEGSVLRQLTRELEMLDRTACLFDAHPRSNHSQILRKEYRAPVDQPELGNEVDAALDADPELKEFLCNGGFSYHPRREYVVERIAELSKDSAKHTTLCSVCGYAVSVTRQCYLDCGHYYDNLAKEQREAEQREAYGQEGSNDL